MIMVDRDIKAYIENGVLKNATTDQVGAISYDLTIKDIITTEEEKCNSFLLEPFASVMVSTVETIEMPDNLVGHIIDKNSQIRRGLQIAAPLYQPGHKTRIFIRVTNMSADSIEILKGEQIAAIVFEQLEKKPDNVYNGAFVDEYEYKGLASYKDVFSDKIKAVDEKIEDVKYVENKIYGNVLTFMAIFIGIYSLLSINFDMVTKLEFTKQSIFAFNLMISGIIGLFVAFIGNLLPNKQTLQSKICCYGVPVILLIITMVII